MKIISKIKDYIENGVHGVIHVAENPFYVNKNHYCPVCNLLLIVEKESKIVNSSSKEAKDFDFFVVDSYAIGNIKFIWSVFYCIDCETSFTIKEIQEYEESLKGDKTKWEKLLSLVVSILLAVVMLTFWGILYFMDNLR